MLGLMKTKCKKCGAIFNSDTIESCPLCPIGQTPSSRPTNVIFVYKKTEIVADNRQEYLKQYRELETYKKYKTEWMRKAREKQRKEIGKIKW